MDTTMDKDEKENRKFSNGRNMELEERLSIPHQTEDIDKLPETNGFFTSKLQLVGDSTGSFMKRHRKVLGYIKLTILNMAAFAYFFAALHYWVNYDRYNGLNWCNGFGLLVILFGLTYFFLVYFIVIKGIYGRFLYKWLVKPLNAFYKKLAQFLIIRLLFFALIIGATAAFIIYDTWGETERLISLLGLAVLLLLGFLFSANPGHINWRPVIWGAILQFVFGLITIRWYVGRAIFQCLGDKVATFLGYAQRGAAFVFGETIVVTWGVFAFSVLTVIFFFSMMVEILYYWGAMQWVCLKLGWILQATCGTTVCESLISVANVFLGNTESPLMIKPYLKDLTPSELHVVMSSGFATVSGTILAAYISFGAEPAHLITASVMSAPAAICYSKLIFPETKKSKTTVDNIEMVESEDSTVLGAASRGASAGTPLVLNIVANLVAFVALVAFINGLLGFFGGLVGYGELTMELIFGKVFIPLSWIMGVPWEECEMVGTLIGLKTVVNEFVAYQRMGEFKDAGLLSARAEAIATYALCGFTNPGAGAIMIGAIGAMAPNQRETLTKIAVRAFFSGCAICFMTACIAGLLMTPDSFPGSVTATVTTEIFNSTITGIP